MHRVLFIVAALAYAGCDAGDSARDAGAPAHCDRSQWTLAWDEEGLPPPGAPLEWPPPPEFEWDDRGVTMTYVYPWDQKGRQAYYLRRGDDGFHARFGLWVGRDLADTTHVFVDFFLNAERIPVIVDGSEVHRATVSIVDGRGDVEVFIPYEQFRPGMNNLHLVRSIRTNKRFREPFSPVEPLGGWSITVARDAAAPATEWTGTPGLRPGVYRPGRGAHVTYVNRDGDEDAFIGAPRVDGSTLRATLRLQRTPSTLPCDPPVNDTFAVLAVLDGEHVPIAGHDRIIATLAEGEARELDFELELPTTPGEHTFYLAYLPGLGRPAELQGRRNPQSVPWPFHIGMSLVSWEVPADESEGNAEDP